MSEETGAADMGNEQDAASGQLSHTIDRILKHHEFMRQEIPAIRALIDKCVKSGEVPQESLSKTRLVFEDVANLFEEHLKKEEGTFFPMIRTATAAHDFSSIAHAVTDLRKEHDTCGDDFARLQLIFTEVILPDCAAGLSGPAELRQRFRAVVADLQVHISEEEMLFSWLEKQLARE